jgi:hypothetical protein
MSPPNKMIAWISAIIAVVISGLIVFFVSEWMWLGVILFLASILFVFVLSVGNEGWGKATWEAVKRLLTGW